MVIDSWRTLEEPLEEPLEPSHPRVDSKSERLSMVPSARLVRTGSGGGRGVTLRGVEEDKDLLV